MADHLNGMVLQYGAQALPQITQGLKGLHRQMCARRKDERKLQCQFFKDRLCFSATLAYLQGTGMLKDALAAYVAEHWPGKQMAITQWQPYMNVATRLRPEMAALGYQEKGRRSAKILQELAALEDAACRALLEDYVLDPQYRTEFIRKGIEAARRHAWLEEPVRLEVVREAVHGKRVRIKKKPPTVADQMDAMSRATTNLGKAEGNHQHLYGVHPNPYPEQWDYLRHLCSRETPNNAERIHRR